MSLLSITLAGAGMVVLAVVIRAVGMNRLPKLTFVAIWTFVALRLILPFYITVPQPVGVSDRLPLAAEVITDWLPSAAPLHIAAATADNPQIDPLPIMWLAGAAAGILYFLITHLKFRRKMSDSLPVTSSIAASWQAENPLLRRVEIRQTHKTASPLTYGAVRPVILLPSALDWEDESSLRYILAHEYVHIRRFDYLLKLLYAAALCVHWFNPLAWLMFVLANRDLELSCDEAVLTAFGEKSKSAYAMTLLESALGTCQPSLSNGFSNLHKTAIEERIIAMKNMKKKSVFGIIAALTVVLAVMVACSTATAAAPDGARTQVRIPLGEFQTAIDRFLNLESQEFLSGLDENRDASQIIFYDEATGVEFDLDLWFGGTDLMMPVLFHDLDEALALHVVDGMVDSFIMPTLPEGFAFQFAYFCSIYCPINPPVPASGLEGHELSVVFSDGERTLLLSVSYMREDVAFSRFWMGGDLVDRNINGRRVIAGNGVLSLNITPNINYDFRSPQLTRAEMLAIAESLI